MMKTSMERLERWLEINLPEVHEDLAPGCSDASIAEFERQLSRVLPESLKDLYRWHDGQKGAVNSGLFFGLNFLSLADAKSHWESWKSIIDDWSPEDMVEANAFSRSAKPGTVRELYANAYWIPFAYDYGGNHLGVDLDPGECGVSGQVINFGSDEEEKFVLANSVDKFLEWLVNQLEKGNFAINEEDDGGRSLNTKEPATSHFLDSVPILFASQ
jgi:cell wall assembly regulator SMI1